MNTVQSTEAEHREKKKKKIKNGNVQHSPTPTAAPKGTAHKQDSETTQKKESAISAQ